MLKQHFDETYSLNGPENYERFFVPAISEPLAEDLIKLAELRPGERVLDVACGTGIVARLAFQTVGPAGLVAGLDANPGMLAVARSFTQEEEPIEWYEASAEAMPFPDDTFDVVLCQLSLQFMENQAVALQEMRRVLVPGGRLILNMPGPMEEVFSILSEAMRKNISAKASGFVDQVFSLYDKNEIHHLMSGAELNDINIMVNTKKLQLPAPKEFLWQYIYSTPLAAAVSETDEESRLALENEVVDKWQAFVENGGLHCEQQMITVSALR